MNVKTQAECNSLKEMAGAGRGDNLVEVWVFELFIVCFLFQLDENVADLVELGDFRLGCQKRQIESLRFSLAAADERIASMHELNLCAEQEVKSPLLKLSYISVRCLMTLPIVIR